ncbi:MAG: hypothetical protein K0S99_3601, partial [Thermomicrobiales bacterium]|nr:hypothetical protein [Thermomicrobiales bacterium]
TSRAAFEAMERVATSHRPAIRMLVSPVGESCSHFRLGEPTNGAISVDRDMRAAIDAPDPIEVGREALFEILLSELDLKNRTCKFALRDDDDDDPDHRLVGEITDPVIHAPNNPYSDAMNSQHWLHVRGKPGRPLRSCRRQYQARFTDADERHQPDHSQSDLDGAALHCEERDCSQDAERPRLSRPHAHASPGG